MAREGVRGRASGPPLSITNMAEAVIAGQQEIINNIDNSTTNTYPTYNNSYPTNYNYSGPKVQYYSVSSASASITLSGTCTWCIIADGSSTSFTYIVKAGNQISNFCYSYCNIALSSDGKTLKFSGGSNGYPGAIAVIQCYT
jgi:hypothetical protein